MMLRVISVRDCLVLSLRDDLAPHHDLLRQGILVPATQDHKIIYISHTISPLPPLSSRQRPTPSRSSHDVGPSTNDDEHHPPAEHSGTEQPEQPLLHCLQRTLQRMISGDIDVQTRCAIQDMFVFLPCVCLPPRGGSDETGGRRPSPGSGEDDETKEDCLRRSVAVSSSADPPTSSSSTRLSRVRTAVVAARVAARIKEERLQGHMEGEERRGAESRRQDESEKRSMAEVAYDGDRASALFDLALSAAFDLLRRSTVSLPRKLHHELCGIGVQRK